MFSRVSSLKWFVLAAVVVGASVATVVVRSAARTEPASAPQAPIVYKPRSHLDTSGFYVTYGNEESWFGMTHDQVVESHNRHLQDKAQQLDLMIEAGSQLEKTLMTRTALHHSLGEPEEAYATLKRMEAMVRGSPNEGEMLYTVIYYLGLSAFRMGETENCIRCRGESSCIFPISRSAVHLQRKGSELAVEHFTDYMEHFPDDLEVKWLLNLANMTLGEPEEKIDPRFRINMAGLNPSEFAIPPFRDVSHLVGLTRTNQSGGAIFEDFDNDGLLDLFVTDWDPDGPMAFYRNKGDGTFEDRTEVAGLGKMRSGLNCMQTDFNNDGFMDIFVPRGAWMSPTMPMKPLLLKNTGKGGFVDVTKDAGLDLHMQSNSASWADYDNDGHLDVFITGHHRPCPLFRNRGDGTFEEVAEKAGLPKELNACLGAAWIDYDNDSFPDLFLNLGKGVGGPPSGTARLYHNNRNGTFTNVTEQMGIDGPTNGFSCWAFDFDNDGWLDIFAASTSHTLEDIVKGLLEQPHSLPTAKLYRNLQGKKFQDVTLAYGLGKVYSPMGSNFGDIDNDGYLDFFLGTGDPCLSTLCPNRLFKNVEGKRFSEVTTATRTGHLQKGHGIAFADWDRNGAVDIFAQLGGAVRGDRYHNVLFRNPGTKNNWINVKLAGTKTNRAAAVGARIAVYANGEKPLALHRHVSSGSSFGANPYEQHIGIGTSTKIDRIEVTWPVTGHTQTFRNVPINAGLVITEGEATFQTRNWRPIPIPAN